AFGPAHFISRPKCSEQFVGINFRNDYSVSGCVSIEPPELPCTSTHKCGRSRVSSQAGPLSSLSMAIVEALPATTQKSAITLTAVKWRTGQPVLGFNT